MKYEVPETRVSDGENHEVGGLAFITKELHIFDIQNQCPNE